MTVGCFEDRHRELRAADEGERAAWLSAVADASNTIAAARLLDLFEARLGPFVDDLVAAVRELRDAPRDGTVDIAALHRRMDAALTALDEEAARG